ncbi:MAG: hypothetical protein WC548_00325 [Candidatus Pacearchaeota archaeon]
MKKREEKKRLSSGFSFLILVVVLVLLGFFLWRAYYSEEKCINWECFNANLEKCDRTKFIGGTEMIFEYTILGNSEKMCRIDVKLLQGELNNQDSIKLEGKSMICELPSGSVAIPEKNIKNCHGILKEGLQELFIIKLHTYIVQNLGKINLETMNIPEELMNGTRR